MREKNLQYLLQSVKEAIKDINLKDDDILSFSDENYRVRVSPYRLTLEIRFPEGIHNQEK